MTNKNFLLNLNKPFLLKPCGKDYLWGGTRLNNDFSKGIPMDPLAETWECSTHPDGLSVVGSGKYQGRTLAELLKRHPEYLGHAEGNGELPFLIKFIDAEKDLSVQVHPDDEYAARNENGQPGKTEFWYVLDADENAELIYGFRTEISQETLKKSIREGTIEKYLQRIPIHRDDLFYIQAGTVHAIGAGALIAEIQENSNLTYRLYDYDRVDRNGKKREIHLEKALDVANLKASGEPVQPLRVLRYRKGCASEILCRCKYFEIHRMLINTERYRQMANYQTDGISFRVLLCVAGCGCIFFGEEEACNYFKGDCIFVPANSVPMKIHGKAQFLEVRG